MSNFPIYHGITLAANSWVENLVVERLEFDPTPVEAGRVWYNTTDKVFRQSTLAANGVDVAVKTFATTLDLTNSVAAEQSRAQAAEASLAAAILAEQTRATNAESTLQAGLDAEITRATAAEATLTANLATEVSRATAAEATLTANLNAEVTRASNAEATLQANIDAEATARQNADSTLQANLNTEITRASNAESTLNAAVLAEVTRATGAESTLTANLAAETSRAQAAEASIAASVAALGSAFNYVGTVSGGGTAGTAFDMSALAQKDAGDYYKVSSQGYFTDGTSTFYANTNDGLVWNLTGSLDKIDNTDPNVNGTTNEISVTGSIDTGFTVAIDSVFSGRMTSAENAILAEVTRASNAESTLTAALNSEITRASNAEATLQSNVDAEATLRANADSTLQANLNTEITRASNAEATLTANLNSEITRATAAEATLTANLNSEVTRATAAEATLTANLNSEITRATAAEATLTSNLNSEITRATAAEATLTANLATETSRAQAAESTLTAAIAAEASRAQSVEGSLGSLTTTNQTNLVGAINELNAALAGGTEAVRDAYDATVFTYDSTNATQNPSGVPQTSYAIAHNLASNFVDVAVWVKRGDGSYYNDIVSVKVNSSSQVTVYLSTAQDVIVICRSAAKLGLVA